MATSPFWFDIYGLSDFRQKEVVEKFISIYTNQSNSADRKEYEISIFEDANDLENPKELIFKTLDEVIEFGENNPNVCFWIYFQDLKADYKRALVKFTFDGKVIFGISIVEEIAEYDNFLRAKVIEQDLAKQLPIKLTSIQVETPPADNETEFLESVELWKNRF